MGKDAGTVLPAAGQAPPGRHSAVSRESRSRVGQSGENLFRMLLISGTSVLLWVSGVDHARGWP